MILVLILYWILPCRWQNRLLLGSSYVFYAFFDLRFTLLIFITTIVTFLCTQRIAGQNISDSEKRLFFWICIGINLTILAIFKYYNFFAENMQEILNILGQKYHIALLHIALPAGISFYTFKAMSYCIDVYRKSAKPADNFPDFALYISFFPQLLAGPIERAKNFLPQLKHTRKLKIENIQEGGWLILWGVFKKIFVADNLADIVNHLFSDSSEPAGLTMLIGVYTFSLQLYCDFSGYSDMATGIAKLMGIKTPDNFRQPFFACNIQDFWGRWHISLTTWIRDYIFYPLSLRKFAGKPINVYWVTLISFTLMGFWHGAAWNFILWGFYHALVLCVYYYIKPYFFRIKKATASSALKIQPGNAVKIFFTFNVVCLGGLFFKADNISHLLNMLNNIFSFTFNRETGLYILQTSLLMTPVFAMEYWMEKTKNMLVVLNLSTVPKFILCLILYYLLIVFGAFTANEFIYAQF